MLGALNGAYGDRLTDPLALELELRGDAAATGTVAVFVHGLGETDASWRLGGGATYGERLREELGITPLYARYNTGRHISDNGRALPPPWRALPAEEIVLVGHSMGGLVARSACHYGDAAWTGEGPARLLPRLAAPRRPARARRQPRRPPPAPAAGDRAVRAADRHPLRRHQGPALRRLPGGGLGRAATRTASPTSAARSRSCRARPTTTSAPRLTRDKDHPLARVIGDLLVQFPSASGAGPARRLAFEIDNGVHLGGVNHFQLLNHPKVYEQLAGWLARAS